MMGGTRSLVLLAACSRALQPDILLIIADDVGFNGVGYQSDYTNVSSGFLTPRLDALAAESLKLSSFYVLPLCAPTRAALLTGRYPTRYGLSAFNADWGKPWGLPANETLLPELLKAANYVGNSDPQHGTGRVVATRQQCCHKRFEPRLRAA